MVHLGTQLQSKLLHKTESERIRNHFKAVADVAYQSLIDQGEIQNTETLYGSNNDIIIALK